jgi:ABC-2 type transport system ATP-binding protein
LELNHRIEGGEVFCLLGANGGAGKTTTINLFLNFVPPTSGTAKIKGLDVTQHSLETKKYIAYIPEQVMLYKNLTGLENLQYFSALAGRTDYTKEDFLKFFDEVGLSRGRGRATNGHVFERHAAEGRDRHRPGQESTSAVTR